MAAFALHCAGLGMGRARLSPASQVALEVAVATGGPRMDTPTAGHGQQFHNVWLGAPFCRWSLDGTLRSISQQWELCWPCACWACAICPSCWRAARSWGRNLWPRRRTRPCTRPSHRPSIMQHVHGTRRVYAAGRMSAQQSRPLAAAAQQLEGCPLT